SCGHGGSTKGEASCSTVVSTVSTSKEPKAAGATCRLRRTLPSTTAPPRPSSIPIFGIGWSMDERGARSPANGTSARSPIDAQDVAALLCEALQTSQVRVERVPRGFGNENWRVTDAAARSYVVKVGPRESAAKWESARRAYELAESVRVPVPRLVHFASHDEYVVRIFEWVDGRSPREVANATEAVSAFLTTLGAAVAALHPSELDVFCPGLDGSAPSFRRWADYVDYRLGQIPSRCSDHEAVDRRTLDRASTSITAPAHAVNDAARPTLCHRDLYA